MQEMRHAMGVFCQIVYDLLLELVIGEDEEESEKEKRKGKGQRDK